MAKKEDPHKGQPLKRGCTSVKCSHTSNGHCTVMMCANYRGDCPSHA